MATPIQESFNGMTIRSPTHLNHPLTPASVHSPSMAPGETLRERALIIQDILSSFDAKALPSETCPTIFNNIGHNSDTNFLNRPPEEEWTIQNDLRGTLLNRAAYDESFFNAVLKLQPPNVRATIFRQKIENRFRICITQYDQLMASPPANVSEFRDSVMAIVQDFRQLSSIFDKDTELRQSEPIGKTVETQAAATLLSFLEHVCERDQVISLAGHYTRSAPTSNSNLTLFRQLIGRDSPKGEPFFLASLERFENYALIAHTANLAKMISVRDMLEELNAPAKYLNRFKALWETVSDPIKQSVPGGPSGHESGHKADRNSRDKRTHEESQDLHSTPKRGKKTA